MFLVRWLKRALYFPVAYYFAFFARIRLDSWRPRVIVVTGSSGKTSLLNLLESQIGGVARYSHHANSAIGIPFNILGLERKSLLVWEWPKLFLLAPFMVFKKPYEQKLYIVEADCDRHPEGKFLTNLLKPEIVLWLSSTRTHSMNFDYFVKNGKFPRVEEAIAYEFGFFIEKASKLSIINSDSELIVKQLPRTKSVVLKVSKKDLKSYEVSFGGTQFIIKGKKYSFSQILPEEFYYSLAFTVELLKYLGLNKGLNSSKFHLPPGRSNLFKGIKNIKILDSTYNANFSSMIAIFNIFEKLKSEKKWVVLGDMLELGEEEKEEHEKLAVLLSKMNLKRIVLLGPRLEKYTYPKLKSSVEDKIIIDKFLSPKDVLDCLQKNITGEELILFKGARFLEGVIENLLADKNDVKYLTRREKVWEIRRKQWGL